MPWFNVDDGFANSKPVLKIPRRYRCAAIGLWTLAGSWSAKELTDGFIPDEAIEEFAGTPQLAEHLVRAGLWKKIEDGWQFEGWAKWQKTKEKVLAYREREAEKKRGQRSNPKTAGSGSVSPGDTSGTETRVPEGQHRESPTCPAQPLPTPLPSPKPQEKDDYPLPPEPPADEWVAPTDVVVDAPEFVGTASKPPKQYGSSGAKYLVRQALGSGHNYPNSTIEALAFQVDKLLHEKHPEDLIREAISEWSRRPKALPSWLPNVYSDVVQASRATTPAGKKHKLRLIAELEQEQRAREEAQALESAPDRKELA
ncbi:hypothetical protein SAMN04488581_2637 [Mycolicibacterium neoaurum]|uniref:hypothetical protein n=1 Tax=Mycolicibacterium neoaurum TaxID=1795 RepID=UPI0008909FD2|nr:hypothetical protein [Mycolicibacterium neoaurum]SDD60191.1 hypothetical protein SAMN04488581_2637 [Mycolicibacterium neoaurum]